MLKNKTVLLTGASGGIGSGIATRLSEQGALLLLVGRDGVGLQALNTRLGGQHQCIQADISKEEDRILILQQCQSKGLDILINNAGIGQFSLFEKLSADEINAILNINLTSTLLLSQRLLPELLKRNESQLINIGSILGSIGFPGSTVYCASKFGLRGFTQALRRELLDTSLSVRYFAPRATKTKINNDTVVAMNNEIGTKMDTATQVVDEFMTFLNARSAQYYLGWPEKLFVKINSMLPRIVEASILKQLPIVKRYLKQGT